MGGSVRLQRPHLHLAEPLSTELGLAPRSLLSDQRVGTNGASVNLIIYEMSQLHEVDITDRHLLMERLPGSSVVENSLPRDGETGSLEPRLDLFLFGAIKDR